MIEVKNKSKKVKAPRMFPLLYDISDFKIDSHPEYHPDSTKFEKYWEKMEIMCLEGMWGDDSNESNGGWRYMPGFLFYYVNFCIIDDEDDKGNTTARIKPMLRDVEWLLSYGWMTCRGFSGFEGDLNVTSHRLVKKIEDLGEESLTGKEKRILKKIEHSIKKPDGTYKDYVESRDYLYETHSHPMGKPYYYNQALNFFVLGSRGFGKSFFCGNAVIGHEYNFYGKRYFDDSYKHNPAPVEIFVGAALAAKSADLLKKFNSTQEWLKKNHGAWGSGKEFVPGYFHNNSSGTLRPNAGDSSYRHEYKYQEGNTWLTGGTGTKIAHGVYTTENPQAAVGTRPTTMVIEEVGLLGNLLDVHASNETCQIRRTKFGSSFYIGTGGNMEKITESKIVFEDPEAYNFLSYKDIWEGRSKPIGFFLPAYYVDNDFKDEQGNTDIDEALAEELVQRKMREKAATSSALDGYMMARPLVPSEMFLSPTANIFPTAKLREREAFVMTNDIFQIEASIGKLHWGKDRKSVHWEEDVARKMKPITTMNLDSLRGDINGAIVIYEHPPESIPNPTYRKSLYKLCYDPVKDDGGGTSLASIVVYKGFVDGPWNMGTQDDIVAEYIGRYDRVNDIHDIALKLATYFNGKVMVENNIPDFIRYCKMKGYHHRLQISPYEAISKAIKNPSAKYEMGVNMTKQLNIHCEQLLRQWYMEDWRKTEDEEKQLYNLNKIRSPRLLAESIAYNRDGNFDHISSMKLLVLWLSQERMVPIKEERATKPMKDMNGFLKRRKQYSLANKHRPFHAY